MVEIPSSHPPPLLWILTIQLVATIADTILARVVRVEFAGSPRRSLIGQTVAAAVVTSVCLLFLQHYLPIKYSSNCMVDGGLVPCCGGNSMGKDGEPCGAGDGGSQGITNVVQMLYLHPWLLLNGVSGIVYACATVILLSHSAGQILKVNSTMFSTFLIAPTLKIFNPESIVSGVPLPIVLVAAFGATLSSITAADAYALGQSICGKKEEKPTKSLKISTKELDDLQDFIDATGTNKKVIIGFSASWCGPCQMIKPHFAQLAKENSSATLGFAKVDTDANLYAATKGQIKAVPTFQCWQNGEMIESFSGSNVQKLKHFIQKHADDNGVVVRLASDEAVAPWTSSGVVESTPLAEESSLSMPHQSSWSRSRVNSIRAIGKQAIVLRKYKIGTDCRYKSEVCLISQKTTSKISRRHSIGSLGIEEALAATGTMSLAGAFVALSASMALWTVLQRYAQKTCGVNHLGFIAIDQVASAPYILLYTVLVSMPPLDRALLWSADKQSMETLRESVSHTWSQATRNRCAGVLMLIFSRVLMCLTIAGGFLLVVMFDPAVAVLQMSVMRLLVSWVSTIVLIKLFPETMRYSEDEKRKAFDFANIVLRMIGSAILISVLVVVSSSS